MTRDDTFPGNKNSRFPGKKSATLGKRFFSSSAPVVLWCSGPVEAATEMDSNHGFLSITLCHFHFHGN